MSALDLILERLAAKARPASVSYRIPGLWLNNDNNSPGAVAVDPYHFYTDRIRAIIGSEAQPMFSGKSGGDWSEGQSFTTCSRA